MLQFHRDDDIIVVVCAAIRSYCLTTADISTSQDQECRTSEEYVHGHRDAFTVPGTYVAVDAVYISPPKGRVFVDLMNANDDILLRIDAIFEWYGWKNIVVLNSKKADGDWGEQVETDQFPFPCCGQQIPIAIRVEIDSSFVITANGMDVASYPYREGLCPPVDKVIYRFEPSGEHEIAELKTIAFSY